MAIFSSSAVTPAGLTIQPDACGAFAERGQVAAAAAIRPQPHHDHLTIKSQGDKLVVDANLEWPAVGRGENRPEALSKLSDRCLRSRLTLVNCHLVHSR